VSEHLTKLRSALQENLQPADDPLGVITGYVVIAQWSDTDGDIWLSRVAGDINDDPPAMWTIQGWLWHTLDTMQHDADQAAGDG
jgi:hypothetical protein